MVLLSYLKGGQANGPSSPGRSGIGAGSSVENGDGILEVARSPYIDNLYKFTEEEYVDEEKCDLFFICQHGDEVPAHRLVISNASKYIMAMQDDQPPWYPVYISVPDLSKEIVQTLVQLAYTGKMNTHPTKMDELVDAMQTLGWIHTDCLTSSYTDIPAAPNTDEDTEAETIVSSHSSSANRFGSDTDDGPETQIELELDLPEIPISDEEEEDKISLQNTPKKKLKGRSSPRKSIKANNTTPSKPVAASPGPKATRKKASPVAKNIPTEESDPEESVVPPKSEAPKRGGRKTKVEANSKDDSKTTTANPEETEPEASQEPLRSRTRTIRKPKKFDDQIVMTPTKRKESPTKASPNKVKSPTKVPDAKPAEEVDTEGNNKPNSPAANKKANVTETPVTKTLPKSRRSTSTEKNSLITSYFKRNQAAASNSAESVSNAVENNIEPVQNSTEATASDKGATKSRKSSRLEEKSDPVDDNNDIVIIDENGSDDKKENDVDIPSSSTLRKRARSTASTKSDKDGTEAATSNSNHDDPEASKTGPGRRKRSLEGNEVKEQPESETNDPTPKRRGRKPSTMSNASKSSKASNKEADSTVDGDLDESETAPRRKRTRQE